MTARIMIGHVLTRLAELSDESVHCVVTSPPYWGLRDYDIPPQIWGGDPACSHGWSNLPRRTPNTQGAGGDRVGRANGAAQASRGHDHGAFCTRCDAWRGALGLEPDYRLYVEHIVAIFREVRRVLRVDGTLWLNLGDCYATGAGLVDKSPGGGRQGTRWKGAGHRPAMGKHAYVDQAIGPQTQPNRMPQPGLKPKDLVGIPWRVALALQEDGWWLRRDIIWHKPAPMPESIRDRPTTSHEYLFLLSKAERYHYDADAIAEPTSPDTHARSARGRSGKHKNADGGPGNQTIAAGPPSAGRLVDVGGWHQNTCGESKPPYGRPPGVTPKSAPAGSGIKANESFHAAGGQLVAVRNKRSVWTVPSEPFPEAHFATYPPALIEPCVLAGCPVGGTVLDPFFGAGTTGIIADRLGRDCIGIELNPAYAEMARRRIEADAPERLQIGGDQRHSAEIRARPPRDPLPLFGEIAP